MRKTTVLVTGAGGGGHGEQILKALRLAPTGYDLVAADITAQSAGFALADRTCILPPASEPGYIGALLSACSYFGARVVIHGSEPELRAMSAARAELEAGGLFVPINPAEVIALCMDKSRTMGFLAEHGFAIPRSRTIRSIEDLEDVDFFPAILKPSIGAGGSAGVFLAQTPDEVALAGSSLLHDHGEFIAQEYVGRPEDEYTVGVLMDMDGQLLNSIAVRRFIMSSMSNRIKIPNRTGRPELGLMLAVSSGISQGEIGPFPEVTAACEVIATTLGCRGAVNFQCRLVGSDVVVFEINPRFSGTTSLRAMVGYNEPDVLIRRHVLGETIRPRFPYGSGTILRGLQEVLFKPGAPDVALDLR